MQRRKFLRWLFAGVWGAGISWPSSAITPDEIKQKIQAYREEALAHFPLKLIETTGAEALAKWRELKSAGQGTPVVLASEDIMHHFDNLLTPFGPNGPNFPPLRPVEEILQASAHIQFPDDLAKHKKAESEEAIRKLKAELAANPNVQLPQIMVQKDGKTRTYTREETIADLERGPREPPIGRWPIWPESSPGLSVAKDTLSGNRHELRHPRHTSGYQAQNAAGSTGARSRSVRLLYRYNRSRPPHLQRARRQSDGERLVVLLVGLSAES